MLNLLKEIVIYDTEYTTWEGAQKRNWSGPGEYREVVNIGAIKIETEKAGINGYPTWEFQNGDRIEGEVSFPELSQRTSCPLPE